MINQCLHFRRIHARVWRAAWSNLSARSQEVIANDIMHSSDEYKWFEKKVVDDTMRFFEDPQYHDNDPLTWRLEGVSY